MRQIFRVMHFLSITIISSIAGYAQQTSADSLKEIQRQVDILVHEIERMKLGDVAESTYEGVKGLGPAASRVYQLKKSGVSLAGYGEIVYENYATSREDGHDANKADKIDYLRNVLYVGYRFNDWILFNSEIEVEHASTGKPGGEVSVEFGYIDLMFSKHLNVRAGMVLPPIGIINEKHEPSTFFGTLRPQVERSVIPSTWRANGIGIYGELVSSLNYRVYFIEGLNVSGFSEADGLRGGRQSGSSAIAENFGIAGKLEYSGLAGATIGTSIYTGDSGQGSKDSLGTLEASTTLFSVFAEYVWRGLEVRSLYTQASVDNAGRVSNLVKKTIGSSMSGWYVVAGYDVIPLLSQDSEHYLAPFVQYEIINTQAEVASGFTANKANDRSTLSVGLTYKPHPNVAFKVDYRDNKNEAATGIGQWNLALNYLF